MKDRSDGPSHHERTVFYGSKSPQKGGKKKERKKKAKIEGMKVSACKWSALLNDISINCLKKEKKKVMNFILHRRKEMEKERMENQHNFNISNNNKIDTTTQSSSIYGIPENLFIRRAENSFSDTLEYLPAKSQPAVPRKNYDQKHVRHQTSSILNY